VSNDPGGQKIFFSLTKPSPNILCSSVLASWHGRVSRSSNLLVTLAMGSGNVCLEIQGSQMTPTYSRPFSLPGAPEERQGRSSSTLTDKKQRLVVCAQSLMARKY
jgi:hypothetical protein